MVDQGLNDCNQNYGLASVKTFKPDPQSQYPIRYKRCIQMVKIDGNEVPEGLYYSKDFAWVKIEEDKIRMGITDFAQKSLREIVFAELPNVGGEVKQGEPYGTLESVKAVSDLVAGISGTIEQVNEEVKSKPETLNEDPFGKGWLLVIKPLDLQTELANLMDFNAAVEWHKNQAK